MAETKLTDFPMKYIPRKSLQTTRKAIPIKQNKRILLHRQNLGIKMLKDEVNSEIVWRNRIGGRLI